MLDDKFINFSGKKISTKKFFFALVCFLVIAIFLIIIFLPRFSDMTGHIKYLERSIEHNFFPIPPLFFGVLYFLGKLFQSNSFAIFFILFISVVTKYYLSRKYIFESIPKNFSETFEKNKKILLLEVGIASLLIVTPIYVGGHFVLCKLAPSVWYNSTAIFVLPFSLLLFLYSAKYIEAPNNKTLKNILILVLLNVLIKPSFFFCFALVFPLFILGAFQFGKKFILSSLVVLVGAILLLLEYYFIYKLGSLDKVLYSKNPSSISFTPFLLWKANNINFFTSFIPSLLFPVVVSFIYFKDIRNNLKLKYCWILLIIGILISIFIGESGKRDTDGNFFWQNNIIAFILYLLLFELIVKKLLSEPREKKHYFMLFLYISGVITGAVYIIKYFLLNDYL